MSEAPAHPRDPIGWTVAFTSAFLALCLVRLTIPSTPYFDEVHYVPAAKALLALSHLANPEHPPLGKELIALGIAVLGDGPLGWRITSALVVTLGFFAAMRAIWFASLSRFATLAFGILLATSFLLFVHARIAMLDGIMAGFALVAIWMCAGAFREHETARHRFALAGLAIGCAIATKWNVALLAALPGAAFFVIRARAAGWQFVTTTRGLPVGGMSLVEAAVWLGVLPLVVYALSFAPYAFLERNPVTPTGLLALNQRMLALQQQVVTPHTYQSVWYEWLLNWRAIWYLYEPIDGAQRGVMLIGNPLTMLLGLPALAWCGWVALARRRPDAGAVCFLFALSLSLWIVAPKPVQFYYHYLLPSCFLMAALALALDELWRRGWRWGPLLVLAATCAMFAYFWPILSAAPLYGPDPFLRWTWLDSWR